MSDDKRLVPSQNIARRRHQERRYPGRLVPESCLESTFAVAGCEIQFGRRTFGSVAGFKSRVEFEPVTFS